MKRKSLILIFLAHVLAAAAYLGVQYYLDHIKPPAVPPRLVIERYFEAVKLKDYETAYALVSRAHYFDSFNQFKDRVDMYSPDMRLGVKGEETQEDGTAVVDVDVVVPLTFGTYMSHTRMKLVRIKREWKILHP